MVIRDSLILKGQIVNKFAIVFLIAILAGAAPAQTSAPVRIAFTNTIVKDEVFTITPAMERLNASKYFSAEINPFDQIMVCHLKGNYLGDILVQPIISIDAMKSWRKGQAPVYYLVVSALSDTVKNWVYIQTNEPIQIYLDGALCRFPYSPVNTELDVVYQFTDWVMCRVPARFIRDLGNAKTAKLRVRGKWATVDRTLDKTNIERFRIFAATYIRPEDYNQVDPALKSNETPR